MTVRKGRTARNPEIVSMTNETMTPAERAVAGDDATIAVGRWPRLILRDELADGGSMADALGARSEGQWGTLAREVWAGLYGVGTAPMDAPAEGSEWVAELHRQLAEQPAWQVAQARAKGDAWLASIGAASALRELAGVLPDLPDEDPAE